MYVCACVFCVCACVCVCVCVCVCCVCVRCVCACVWRVRACVWHSVEYAGAATQGVSLQDCSTCCASGRVLTESCPASCDHASSPWCTHTHDTRCSRYFAYSARLFFLFVCVFILLKLLFYQMQSSVDKLCKLIQLLKVERHSIAHANPLVFPALEVRMQLHARKTCHATQPLSATKKESVFS